MSQNQGFSFYKLKIRHPKVDPTRVYPFSHQYGANIAIFLHPLEQKFISAGNSQLEGVYAKDVTLHNYFGTATPTINPLCILTYENQPLGVRYQAKPYDSAFIFDVELGKLTQKMQDFLLEHLQTAPLILTPSGDFTTKLEQEKRLYVADVSECVQIVSFLNGYYQV